MMRPSLVLPALLACAITVLVTPSCGKDEGALMVVVSTDMLIPNDISWLRWRVTLQGETEPSEEGTLQLDANELPATLAIRGGDDTTGAVLVELEGAIGEHGEARVRRSAEVELPNGVKALQMPLDWACSEANLPEGCPMGEACVMGKCQDRRISTSMLSEYTEPEETRCFDTLECFESSFWNDVGFADEGRFRGWCVDDGQSIAEAPDVNVAVIVDSSAVGNYGVCQSTESWDGCLIPLGRGGVDGWQALEYDGRVEALGLPDWVCEQQTVLGVAVAPLASNPSCAVKTGREAPCPADAICIDADTCPPEWPAEWVGTSCHATESPDTDAYGYCGEDGPGRWCCTNGQTIPEDTDRLLIDDMSLGPQLHVTPPSDSIPGLWWAFIQDPFADYQPQSLFTYRAIDPPALPEGGPSIERAACMQAKNGFQTWSAQFGACLAYSPDDHSIRPFDVSPYSGISFWARATPNDEWDEKIWILVSDQNTEESVPDPTCAEPGRDDCGNHWGSEQQLTDTWTEYRVAWDDLRQNEDWDSGLLLGLDRERVYNLMFQVRGLGLDFQSPPFDICVAHLYFTE